MDKDQNMTIQESLVSIANTRTYFLMLADSLIDQELNRIPTGYRNNVVWHLGHIVSVQQSLCYRLSGLPIVIPTEISEKYARHTKPDIFIQIEEIQILKENLFLTLKQLKADLDAKRFLHYKPYITVTNEKLVNIDDALRFDAFHELLHLQKAFQIRDVNMLSNRDEK
ncbi:MAG: DinB family protein [Flammeovirgaceae bacterium]|nr:DinB family protein [Flammeovirgaceae bacterium]